jgi:hypothetical protein
VIVRKPVIAITLVCAAAAPAALATSPPPTSHARFWQNHAQTAACGKRIKQRSFQLLCAAKGVPRPRSGHQGGDPFVVLGRTGKAHLVLLTQREFPAGDAKKLRNGTVWNRGGVKCTVFKKVTCTNRSGHGFMIGDGKYRSF